MNLAGMDYNTERKKLRMPEYGRNIHEMIDHCVLIRDRRERQQCAEAIIAAMEKMNPDLRQQQDYKQKLWDHLAIMSDFKLDIDYPYEITTAEEISKRPDPLPRQSNRIPVRHYGNLVFQSLEGIRRMRPGEERDELVRLVANQMKRNLIAYGSSSPDNERVISDIAYFTNGEIQINPDEFQFEFITLNTKKPERNRKNKKKK